MGAGGAIAIVLGTNGIGGAIVPVIYGVIGASNSALTRFVGCDDKEPDKSLSLSKYTVHTMIDLSIEKYVEGNCYKISSLCH
jgi:hypothetical protein